MPSAKILFLVRPYRHMKIKKSPVGVLHPFSFKKFFYDKMDLRLFVFDEII